MSSDLNSTYYDVSRNDDTRYPQLSGDVAADIVVIGGGFSGVATALTLAERGYSVALIESRRIGAGASGRNGGQVIAGISGEAAIARQLGEPGRRMVRDIRYLGHDIIQRRIKDHNIICDFKSGWMEAAAKSSHMDMLRAHVDESNRECCDLEIVEPENMRDVLGTDAYHGAYIDRRSGHVHPLNLLLGEARAAAGIGVKIFEDSPVVEFSGGARPFVRTQHGRVDAKSIVLAGYSDHAFQRGRLNGLLFPTGSYIIATEALSEATARALNPQDLAVADSNIVLDYFRTSADRRVLFGGRCNYSNRDPKDLIAAMRPRLIEIFPQLKDVRVDYAWGGRIDIVITRVPAIGRLEPNVYFMQGYCGHGVNATHIAADIVSDAICGTMERFDLFDKIKHVRLPVGRWAGNQMLALGMLYYRLRDKL